MEKQNKKIIPYEYISVAHTVIIYEWKDGR